MSDEITKQAFAKITKAKTYLVMQKPFIASLVLDTEMQPTQTMPDRKTPNETAWTDGKRIGFNPEWVASLDQAEVNTMLAHAAMHTALAHHLRRGDRDPQKWDVAGDFVVNGLLSKDGFKIGDGMPLSTQMQNMSTEAVYRKIPDPPPQNKKQQKGGQGQGQGGQKPGYCQVADMRNDDGEEMTEADRKQEEMRLNQRVRDAVDAEKAYGRDPERYLRVLEVTEVELDWRTELLDYMVTAPNKTDYTWTRPNKKSMGAGVYLPSMIGEELLEVVIGVDTSGSIGPRELNAFAGAVENILLCFPNTKAHIIYCDAAVHGVVEVTGSDCPLKLKPMGGGGTSFTPVFKHVQKMGITPNVLIYLTDLEGPRPEFVPPYPVVWVTEDTGNGYKRDHFFGRHLKMKFDK